MLSFGIEYDRAFSIAFWSARFAAGSAPPSRAATMIARDSFENSFPRRASATPFLCLIELHLLCPDMIRLLHQLQEPLVHAGVVGQLRMERRYEKAPFTHQYRLAVQLGEHLDLGPGLAHTRRTDEDTAQRLVLPFELEIGLEARDLSAVGVPVDGDVHEAEVLAVEDDHPRAGTEHRPTKPAQRVVQAVQPHEAHERRRLAAGNDQPIEAFELLRLPHLDRLDAQPAKHLRVLPEISLHSKNADAEGGLHGTDCRLAGCGQPRPRVQLPAARLEQLRGIERRSRDPAHRVAQPSGDARDDFAIAVVRRRLDDRPGADIRVARLEDPRPDKDAVGADLNEESRLSRGRDATRREGYDREPPVLANPLHQL